MATGHGVEVGNRVEIIGGERGKIVSIHLDLGFSAFEIQLESTGKIITEARYRFDPIDNAGYVWIFDFQSC